MLEQDRAVFQAIISSGEAIDVRTKNSVRILEREVDPKLTGHRASVSETRTSAETVAAGSVACR